MNQVCKATGAVGNAPYHLQVGAKTGGDLSIRVVQRSYNQEIQPIIAIVHARAGNLCVYNLRVRGKRHDRGRATFLENSSGGKCPDEIKMESNKPLQRKQPTPPDPQQKKQPPPPTPPTNKKKAPATPKTHPTKNTTSTPLPVSLKREGRDVKPPLLFSPREKIPVAHRRQRKCKVLTVNYCLKLRAVPLRAIANEGRRLPHNRKGRQPARIHRFNHKTGISSASIGGVAPGRVPAEKV